jgi:mono/diheme cytochrome c family protein
MSIMLVGTGVAFAATAYTKSLNARVNIVSANPNLVFFADAAGVVPLTLLDIGDLHRSETINKPFYVKNIGLDPVSVSYDSATLPDSLAQILVLFNGYSQTTIPSNSIIPAVLQIMATDNATLGSNDFVVKVAASSILPPAPLVSYAITIQPLLTANCVMCHGATNPSAGYRYNTYAGTMTTVVSSNATASRLYQSLTGTNGRTPMPPGGSLTTSQLDMIKSWINAGALNN